MFTASSYALMSTLLIANAEPVTATLDLNKAFYDFDCIRGTIEVSVRTLECSETGLYSMTTTVYTNGGKRIETDLKNENPCIDPMWLASIPGIHCTSSNNPVSTVNVSAQVDPIRWKDALEATK